MGTRVKFLQECGELLRGGPPADASHRWRDLFPGRPPPGLLEGELARPPSPLGTGKGDPRYRAGAPRSAAGHRSGAPERPADLPARLLRQVFAPVGFPRLTRAAATGHGGQTRLFWPLSRELGGRLAALRRAAALPLPPPAIAGKTNGASAPNRLLLQ